MKNLDAKEIFRCTVHDYNLDTDFDTVVYKISDTYYDMRLIYNWFDLTLFGRLSNRLAYKEEKTLNYYYGTERSILIDTLRPFYNDERESFTIKELINDMVEDPSIQTDWPGFSTYPLHQEQKLSRERL